MQEKYRVIIEASTGNEPREHEISAAVILTSYFNSDITFLRPGHAKTPDLRIGAALWEMKSPLGNGKRTIDNTFREARKQSQNIIVDLRRIKMHESKARNRIKFYLSSPHRFSHILIISKNSKVIALL